MDRTDSPKTLEGSVVKGYKSPGFPTHKAQGSKETKTDVFCKVGLSEDVHIRQGIR